MLKLWPYKRFSRSAKELARHINVKRIVSPDYRVKRRDIIVNWGNSRAYGVALNQPQAVARATNKLVAFQAMRAGGVSIPEFTTDRAVAQGWVTAGHKAVVRLLLSGHSGQGASVVAEGELPSAPLYTRYFHRDGEYRVHVFKGQVIDFVRKKRRNGYSESAGHNDHIRTHSNGWVFCRNGIVLPGGVRDQAIKAVAALGLDFGAVDILWRERGDQAVVLEVNTAPGLEGTTLQRYAAAIREYMYTASRSRFGN